MGSDRRLGYLIQVLSFYESGNLSPRTERWPPTMFAYLVNDRAETNLNVLTSNPVLFFTAPRFLLYLSLSDCVPALTLILSLDFFRSVSRSYRLFVTPWTAARQAPLSMGFHRQEYWVPISFPRGSSQPRDLSCIPCIGRQILSIASPRKPLDTLYLSGKKANHTG